jgi:hypothetical protein
VWQARAGRNLLNTGGEGVVSEFSWDSSISVGQKDACGKVECACPIVRVVTVRQVVHANFLVRNGNG